MTCQCETLLPSDFGRCKYMQGDDAQMLSCLTSPSVMNYQIVPTDWSVSALLDDIAAGERLPCPRPRLARPLPPRTHPPSHDCVALAQAITTC